jgi:hypothetical protein
MDQIEVLMQLGMLLLVILKLQVELIVVQEEI